MSDEESMIEDAKREEWERKRDRGDFSRRCLECHGFGGNCPSCEGSGMMFNEEEEEQHEGIGKDCHDDCTITCDECAKKGGFR